MPIRAVRLCHHCYEPLSADEVVHYVFECEMCVLSEHDLEAATRADPAHLDAPRLAFKPVDTGATTSKRRVSPRLVLAYDARAKCA